MTLADSDRQLYEFLVTNGFLSAEQSQYWYVQAKEQRLPLADLLTQRVFNQSQWQQIQSHWQQSQALSASSRFPSQGSGSLGRQQWLQGQQLGPFQIQELLGSGGMGTVYKAYDGDNHRTVALKVLRQGQDASEATLQRFIQEARTAARIEAHPHIVELYDAGQIQDVSFISMQYLEGQGLEDWLRDAEFEIERGLEVLTALADAIDHIHAHDIIHRDIKPDNILISADGEAKLLDFGVAKDAVREESLTRTGHMVGTLNYMAPEQLSDAKHVDHRADVYGLGALLYEMLTGRPPHRGSNPVEVMASLLNTEPKRPRALRPEISRSLESICLEALHRDPDQRTASAHDLKVQIQDYLEHGDSPNSSPMLKIVIAVSVVLIVTLTTLIAYEFRPRRKRPKLKHSSPSTPPKEPIPDQDKTQPKPVKPTPKDNLQSPSLTLNARTGQWINSLQFNFQGQLKPSDARLFFNRRLCPQKDGQIQYPATLRYGSNILNFEVEDSSEAKRLLQTLVLNVDNLYPRLTLGGSSSIRTTKDSVDLRVQLQEPHLSELRLDGQPIQAGSGGQTIPLALEPGEHEHHLEAEDRAGNITGLVINANRLPKSHDKFIDFAHPNTEILCTKKQYVFYGRAKRGTQLKCNKEPVKINGSGQFSWPVTLKEGLNTYLFTMQYRGIFGYMRMQLRYDPKSQDPYPLSEEDQAVIAQLLQDPSRPITHRLENISPEILSLLLSRNQKVSLAGLKSFDLTLATMIGQCQLRTLDLRLSSCPSPEIMEQLAAFKGRLLFRCNRRRISPAMLKALAKHPAPMALHRAVVDQALAAFLKSFAHGIALPEAQFTESVGVTLSQRTTELRLIDTQLTSQFLRDLQGGSCPLIVYSRQRWSESIWTELLQYQGPLSIYLTDQTLSLQQAMLCAQRQFPLALMFNKPSREVLTQLCQLKAPLTLQLDSLTDQHARSLSGRTQELQLHLKTPPNDTAFRLLRDNSLHLRIGHRFWRRKIHKGCPKFGPMADEGGPHSLFKDSQKSSHEAPRRPRRDTGRLQPPEKPAPKVFAPTNKTREGLSVSKAFRLTALNINDHQWLNEQYWILKGQVEPDPVCVFVNGAAALTKNGHFQIPLRCDPGKNTFQIACPKNQSLVLLRQLQVNFDNSPPKIVLVKPAPRGVLINEKRYAFAGTITDPNLKSASFNGEALTLSKDGRFQIEMSREIKDGRHEYPLEARDLAGNIHGINVLLEYDPKANKARLQLPFPHSSKALPWSQETFTFYGNIDPPKGTVLINGQPARVSGRQFQSTHALKMGLNNFQIQFTANTSIITVKRVIERLPGPSKHPPPSPEDQAVWANYASTSSRTALKLERLQPEWAADFAHRFPRRSARLDLQIVDPNIAEILTHSDASSLVLSSSSLSPIESFKTVCQFPQLLWLRHDLSAFTEAQEQALLQRSKPLLLSVREVTPGLAKIIQALPCDCALIADTMSPEAALILSKRERELDLVSWPTLIPPAVAKALCQGQVPLKLSTRSVQGETFAAMMAHRGPLTIICQSSLTKIEVWSQSLKHRRGPTSLHFPSKRITPKLAQNLSRSQGSLTLLATNILDDCVPALLQHRAGLHFPRLRSLVNPACVKLRSYQGRLTLQRYYWERLTCPR